MTLNDLCEQLLPTFPPSVRKDVRTAARVLANALTYPDAKSCPLESCLHPLPYLYRSVEAHLIAAGKGAHTVRNTKNNLSRLFRLAETQQLFSLFPATPERRFPTTNGKRARRQNNCRPTGNGSYLIRKQWPPQLEAEFSRFSQWSTDTLVHDRDARWQKRDVTILSYQTSFEAFFGYIYHTRHMEPRFEQLYDFQLIRQFIEWHINERHKRPTVFAHQFLNNMLALLRQYHVDPGLRDQLKAFQKSIPKPPPFYHKGEVMIPLRELERIGIALWPSISPKVLLSKPGARSGSMTAGRACLSLMFRLWVYIPYRQRNMREMTLGQNLYQTSDGQWRIRFSGNELKVSVKQGRTNTFDLPFPPTLVEPLEAYLREWRPLLLRNTHRAELFLNTKGQPYSADTLNETARRQVYVFTGKPWHPHIIRTTWATEWIKSHGDFYTAAIMLNDRLETVIKNYAHLLEENVAEKAFEWVQTRVNGH